MTGESISLLDIATMLKKRMGEAARRAPTREMPDWVVRLLAHFVSDMKMLAPEVGKRKEISNEKARRVLGWTPRSSEESIVATAESLRDLGLLKR
jgi:dihydroflavonol-4-reductase